MTAAYPEELLIALLGPPPTDGPVRGPLGGSYGYSFDQPQHWPATGEGRQGTTFLYSWLAAQLAAQGATLDGAASVRSTTLRRLQSGNPQVIAIHPESGHEIPVPAQFWQGRGEAVRSAFWSGQFWADDDTDTPHELFVIDTELRPDWWPGDKQLLKTWCAPEGPADAEARSRLKARGLCSPSDRAVCGELFAMWRKAGRKNGSPGSIQNARSRLR